MSEKEKKTNEEILRDLLPYVNFKALCERAGVGYEIARKWRTHTFKMSEAKKQQLVDTAVELFDEILKQ